MRWGSRLQDSIAYGAAADKGWKNPRPIKEYMYLPDLRIGSSFDFIVNEEEILEIKNVSERAYAKNWTDEEGPSHLELQLQFQMLISGYRRGYLCALTGGNSLKVIERSYMPSVGDAILKKVKHFWERDTEPAVNFERDAEFIRSLYQNVDPNKIIEGDDTMLALAQRYNALSSQISLAENQKRAVQAQLLMLAGTAEKVRHEKFTLSLNQVKESFVAAHTRAARRGFRLTMRGADEQG